jgi:hypothetical protein
MEAAATRAADADSFRRMTSAGNFCRQLLQATAADNFSLSGRPNWQWIDTRI